MPSNAGQRSVSPVPDESVPSDVQRTWQQKGSLWLKEHKILMKFSPKFPDLAVEFDRSAEDPKLEVYRCLSLLIEGFEGSLPELTAKINEWCLTQNVDLEQLLLKDAEMAVNLIAK